MRASRSLVSRHGGLRVGPARIAALEWPRGRRAARAADEFTSIVEQATGRSVRTFLSETTLDDDISVELFLLGDKLTDMGEFEPEPKP